MVLPDKINLNRRPIRPIIFGSLQVIAALEMFTVVAVTVWFMSKGLEFKRNSRWIPIANVRTRRTPPKDVKRYFDKTEVTALSLSITNFLLQVLRSKKMEDRIPIS